MLKKGNFVTKTAKLMFAAMVIYLSIQPVSLSTAQTAQTAQQAAKEESKTDSIQKAIEIKEKINERLLKEEENKFKIIVHNYDTIYNLKLAKEKKKVLAAKKKSKRKPQPTTTYKMFPISVDSQDLADFTARFPNDTIPIKIEIEIKPKKKNIFNIFKKKNKRNGND